MTNINDDNLLSSIVDGGGYRVVPEDLAQFGLSYSGPWVPYVSYTQGDIVEYYGNYYVCTTPHTSERSIDKNSFILTNTGLDPEYINDQSPRNTSISVATLADANYSKYKYVFENSVEYRMQAKEVFETEFSYVKQWFPVLKQCSEHWETFCDVIINMLRMNYINQIVRGQYDIACADLNKLRYAVFEQATPSTRYSITDGFIVVDIHIQGYNSHTPSKKYQIDGVLSVPMPSKVTGEVFLSEYAKYNELIEYLFNNYFCPKIRYMYLYHLASKIYLISVILVRYSKRLVGVFNSFKI